MAALAHPITASTPQQTPESKPPPDTRHQLLRWAHHLIAEALKLTESVDERELLEDLLSRTGTIRDATEIRRGAGGRH